jgi:large subunit ribosomal protein L5
LPRVRDFKGFNNKQFDGNGNFSLGVKEYTIFPEIDYVEIEKTKGMNIVIVTSAKRDNEAKILLQTLNLPFYH